MRHGDKINNLSRTKAHRKALLSNLANQLIQYKRITTTLAKAKALRVYVEPLITKSKTDSTHNRRLVFSKLQEKETIKELFDVVAAKVADRPGGYTRIIKLQPRIGDAADMAMIELVDFNTIYTKAGKATDAKKTRRSRRTGKATTNQTENAESNVDEVVEEVSAEASVETPTSETEAPVVEDTKIEKTSAAEDVSTTTEDTQDESSEKEKAE